MSVNNTIDDIGKAVVLDTGILIEYLSGSNLGKRMDDFIISNPEVQNIIISDVSITELYYVNCRLRSKLDAQEIIEDLLEWISVCPTNKIRLIAGDLKCHRKISLADCYSIAAAEFHQIPVIFKSENELLLEIQSNPFTVDLRLLQ